MNLLVILIIGTAYWTPYFQNDFGTRAMGMGGVYTVVQSNAVCWNPAGMVDDKKFSISVENKIVDGEAYGNNPEDTLLYISEILPSFIGFTCRIKGVNIGISGAIPYENHQVAKWEEETTTEHPEGTGIYRRTTYNNRFYALNTAIGYAVNRKLSAGLNTAWMLKNYRYGVEYSDSEKTDELLQSEKGVEFTLGLQYSFNQFVKMGVVAKKGNLTGYENTKVYTMNPDETIHRSTEKNRIQETLPLVVSVGCLFNPIPGLYLAYDVSYLNWKSVSFKYEDSSDTLDYLRDVTKCHMGAEYSIIKNVALRIGVYSDPSQFITELGREQFFLTGGIGLQYRDLSLDVAVASSRIITEHLPGRQPGMKGTNLYTSLSYGIR